MAIKNLGPVAGIVRSATAPNRTDILWYDLTDLVVKAYDTNTSTWASVLSSVAEGSGKVSINGETPQYLSQKIDNDTIKTDGQKIYAVTKSPLYTNLTPTPSTVGGVDAGSTFSELTMQQTFDKLFYAYQTPLITLTNPSNRTLEVGQMVNGNGLTATWTVQNAANLVAPGFTMTYLPSSTVVLQEANTLATSGTYNHPDTVRATASTVPVFRLSAIDSKGSSISSTVSYTWQHRIFFGENSLQTLDATAVKALRVSQLKNSYLGQYAFVAGGYKNIAVPADMGTATRFRDPSTGLTVPMNTPYQVTVINSYNTSIVYNVYRTVYQLGGAITIEIY